MDILWSRAAVARSRTWAAAHSGSIESKLVIHLALLGVGKHLVCFLNLLELFLCGFVAGIQIGMVFPREFAVRRAYIFYRSLARNSQQFVIILFGCRSHFFCPNYSFCCAANIPIRA